MLFCECEPYDGAKLEKKKLRNLCGIFRER